MYIGLERMEGMEIEEIKEVEKAHLNKSDCNLAKFTDKEVENLANIMARFGISGEDIDSEGE
jgi:hypothetical protein